MPSAFRGVGVDGPSDRRRHRDRCRGARRGTGACRRWASRDRAGRACVLPEGRWGIGRSVTAVGWTWRSPPFAGRLSGGSRVSRQAEGREAARPGLFRGRASRRPTTLAVAGSELLCWTCSLARRLRAALSPSRKPPWSSVGCVGPCRLTVASAHEEPDERVVELRLVRRRGSSCRFCRPLSARKPAARRARSLGTPHGGMRLRKLPTVMRRARCRVPGHRSGASGSAA